jgi:hypothetical protein
MTDSEATVVHDVEQTTGAMVHTSNGGSDPVMETNTGNPDFDAVVDLFHDDTWAEEFDRRLAAWEAESSSAAPVNVAVPR